MQAGELDDALERRLARGPGSSDAVGELQRAFEALLINGLRCEAQRPDASDAEYRPWRERACEQELMDLQRDLRGRLMAWYESHREANAEPTDLEPAFIKALHGVAEVVAKASLWTVPCELSLRARVWLLSEEQDREESARVPRFILLREPQFPDAGDANKPMQIALPVDNLSDLSSASSIDRGYSYRMFRDGEPRVFVYQDEASPKDEEPWSSHAVSASSIYGGVIKDGGLRAWCDVPLCLKDDSVPVPLGKLSFDLPNRPDLKRWPDADDFPMRALRRLGALGAAGIQALRDVQSSHFDAALRRLLPDSRAERVTVADARQALEPAVRFGARWMLGEGDDGTGMVRVANPTRTAVVLICSVKTKPDSDTSPQPFVDVRRSGEYVGGLVFSTRTPIFVNNVQDLEVPLGDGGAKLSLREDPLGYVREVNYRGEESFACLPLIHEGSAVGTLALSSGVPLAFCGRVAYARVFADALAGYVAAFRKQQLDVLNRALEFLPRTTDLLALDPRIRRKALCLLLTSVTERECTFQFHRAFAFGFDPASSRFTPLFSVGPIDSEEWGHDGKIGQVEKAEVERQFSTYPSSYRRRALWLRTRQLFPHGLPAKLTHTRLSKLGALAEEATRQDDRERSRISRLQKNADQNKLWRLQLSDLAPDDPLRCLLEVPDAKADYPIYCLSIPLGGASPALWLVMSSPFAEDETAREHAFGGTEDLEWRLLHLSSSVASAPPVGLIPEGFHHRPQLVVGPDGRVLTANRAYKERFNNAFTGARAGKLHSDWPELACATEIALAGTSTYVEDVDVPGDDTQATQRVDVLVRPLYFGRDRVSLTVDSSRSATATEASVPAAAIVDLSETRRREARDNKARNIASKALRGHAALALPMTQLFDGATLAALRTDVASSLKSFGLTVKARKIELLGGHSESASLGVRGWSGAAVSSAIHLEATRVFGAYLEKKGKTTCEVGGAARREAFTSVSSLAYSMNISAGECNEVEEQVREALRQNEELHLAFPDAVCEVKKPNCVSEVHVTVRLPEPDDSVQSVRCMTERLCRGDIEGFVALAEQGLAQRSADGDAPPDLPRLVLNRVLRRAQQLFSGQSPSLDDSPAEERRAAEARFCALAGRVVTMYGDDSVSRSTLQAALRHLDMYCMSLQRNRISAALHRCCRVVNELPRLSPQTLDVWSQQLSLMVPSGNQLNENNHGYLSPAERLVNALSEVHAALDGLRRNARLLGEDVAEAAPELERIGAYVLRFVAAYFNEEEQEQTMWREDLGPALERKQASWCRRALGRVVTQADTKTQAEDLQRLVWAYINRDSVTEDDGLLLGALDRRLHAVIVGLEQGDTVEVAIASLDLCQRGLKLLGHAPSEERTLAISTWFEEFTRVHYEGT